MPMMTPSDGNGGSELVLWSSVKENAWTKRLSKENKINGKSKKKNGTLGNEEEGTSKAREEPSFIEASVPSGMHTPASASRFSDTYPKTFQ